MQTLCSTDAPRRAGLEGRDEAKRSHEDLQWEVGLCLCCWANASLDKAKKVSCCCLQKCDHNDLAKQLIEQGAGTHRGTAAAALCAQCGVGAV